MGSYAITQGTLALSDNYTLTYVGADLTITARPITVTADAKSKVYGEGDAATHAFFRRNGRMIDLNPAGGTNSWAYALNDGGDVAGSYQLPNGQIRAFVYRRGKFLDLGIRAQKSEATLVSEDGQVAGYFVDVKGRKHSFIYVKGS